MLLGCKPRSKNGTSTVGQPESGGQVEYIEDMLLKGGELWFVYVLFFIFLIWPPILHRLSKKGIAGIIVILAIACQVIPGDFNDSIFLYPRILSYSVFFLAGYVMKNVNRDILSCNRNFGIVSVLLSSSAVCWFRR